MDDRRFDNLARSLAGQPSRRELLRLFLRASGAAAILTALAPLDRIIHSRRDRGSLDGRCDPGQEHCASGGVAAAQATPLPDDGETVMLLAAGDIAACDSSGDEATADLLDRHEGTVVLLGDTAYQAGTPQEFAECYDPTWGRHKDRTRPGVGDHEYNTPDASGYFEYFRAAAGDPDKGYYSFNLGTWHIIVLNSNCEFIGGCRAGSPEEKWLRADLAANPATCILASFHYPRFSSGITHGSNRDMGAFWQALYEAGADVVLSGHEHNYERFAPQTPAGVRDDERGIRQFVVGTGGIGHYPLGKPIANSEVRNDQAWGILEMTLRPGAYDWRFIPVEGQAFTDSGSGICSPVVREFPAIADTTVRAEDPYANLGTAPTIEVDSRLESWAYLRFEVQGVTEYIGSARLRLYAPPGEFTGRGPEVYSADNAWSENTITWNDRPELTGGPYGSVETIAEGSWVDIDISEAVTSDGTYTFVLVPRSEDGIAFVSSNNRILRPRLVLTLDLSDLGEVVDASSA
jgi:hypothetical protein